MKEHQKFFSLKNSKTGKIERFITVANIEAADNGETILKGNQKVLYARLSDAKFFWENDIRLIQKDGLDAWLGRLVNVTFHNKLGSQADKVTRVSALTKILAKRLLCDIEDAVKSANICKSDLASEMVYEFPELQGVMGRYYALSAGYSQDVAKVCEDHYAPKGPNDPVPTASISVAVSLADKLDTLLGFWIIDEKPTSSKDPFALRRITLGIIRTILENRRDIKLNDHLNYASNLYYDQGYNFTNKDLQKELQNFLKDRFRYYLKEKQIRFDIIDASISTFSLNRLSSSFEKAKTLNKVINTQKGLDIISSYKRASNILEAEMRNGKFEINNSTDPGIFKTDFEKNLYKKINEIKKYYSVIDNDENFEKSLSILAEAKKEIFDFFDNVKVNEENEVLRKNRLELIDMLCKTFQNFVNFQLLKVNNE